MSRVEFGERWFQGEVLSWMNELVKEKGLAFDGVEQEVQIQFPWGLRRYPDLVIWRDRKKRKVACLIELKGPFVDAYDEELIEDGLKKANELGCLFFATWNVNKLVLWETFVPGTRLIDRRLRHWDVVDVRRVEDIKRVDIERRVKNVIATFLEELAKYYAEKDRGREPLKVAVIPKLYPDEIMVLRLRSAVDTLYLPVSDSVRELKDKDPQFFRKVGEWFAQQGWIFDGSDEDFDRLSRQAVYLIINKILFYNVLKDKFRLQSIDAGKLPDKGDLFEKELWSYFNPGVKLGYGLIFASDFLEQVPIPDDAVPEAKKLIAELNKYDFSKLGYDIVGRIFEKLIPQVERHKLGQYFTRSEVVDLILGFTIKDSDALVLDPACGSGTFLIRSYYRKLHLAEKQGMRKSHDELLRELWGIDISKFPSTLSEINLLSRNLDSVENKPMILCRDFFDVMPGVENTLFEAAEDYEEVIAQADWYRAKMPDSFGCVVTNPPYTRQEEMEDVLQRGYKDRLRTLLQRNLDVTISQRASIYAYFFYWGAKFLKEGGRLGLVTSNSWLDVDFGKYLQDFFLKNFRIIAIIESKVERWFEDADINTAITILEKCGDREGGERHQAKFIQLKKPLDYYLPPFSDEEARQKQLDQFVHFLEDCDKTLAFKEIPWLGSKIRLYEDEKLRVVMVSQKDLYNEGFNDESGRFEGAKWGKYIRAPEIFYKVLEKGKDLFVPLKEVAEIRFGIKTGANEFFYLIDDEIQKWGIEREFWMHPITREEYAIVRNVIPRKDLWLDKTGKYFLNSQYAREYALSDLLVGQNVIWIPNYLIKSPKEVGSVVVDIDRLKFRVLLVRKDKEEIDGTNVLKYIEWGEENGFHKRPTCASRQRWYELPKLPDADILFRQFFDVTFNFPLRNLKVLTDHTFYYLCLRSEQYSNVVAALFNSTLYNMIVEIYGRNVMGQGVLINYGPEMRPIPLIDPSRLSNEQSDMLSQRFESLAKRPIGSIFDEIGAKAPEEVLLSKVMKDRLELDKVIISEILGLSDAELLELYRSAIDLVKSRLDRAKSVERRKKKNGYDVVALSESILRQLDLNFLHGFPEKYLQDIEYIEIEMPKGKATVGIDLIAGIHVKIGTKKIPCSSEEEAEYLRIASELGMTRVKIPKNPDQLRSIVKDLSRKWREAEGKIKELLLSIVPDEKIRAEVEREIWKKMARS